MFLNEKLRIVTENRAVFTTHDTFTSEGKMSMIFFHIKSQSKEIFLDLDTIMPFLIPFFSNDEENAQAAIADMDLVLISLSNKF